MTREDISEKLKRLKQSLPAGVVTGKDLLRKSGERELPDLTRFIPGEVRSCEEGTCFVTDEFFPYDGQFGNYPLDRLRNLDAREICETFAFDRPEPGRDRILFLDTETTGLAGGTGTYAFQVGIGWVEEDGFRIVQYFMRDYEEEPAQMALLSEEMKRCGLLVTYNGGPFDLPLLRTRFVFNRVRVALEDIPHLDLLPVARRLWKPAHGAANLSLLEEKVLGNEREGDVPGALIPALYFQFLRGASPRTVSPVFYHNQMDIIALAALTEKAFTCHRYPESIEDDWERHGVARFFEKRNLLREAVEVLSPIVEDLTDTVCWHLSCRLSGLLFKKLGEHQKAADVWWKVHSQGIFDPVVLVELAKHLEHREKDYLQARSLVSEIFEGYDIVPDASGDAPEEDADFVEEEIQYDYSDGAKSWDEDLPVRKLNEWGEYSEEPRQVPIPNLTDRFRADLNRRLRRLERKMGKLK
jgi:uncharacterized protein YprB with RNaseH-like and TPR domain